MAELGVGEIVLNTNSKEVSVVLGNGGLEDGTIWCADWATLKSKHCAVSDLVPSDVDNPTWEDLLCRMETMAESGDADAMWWCAWAHEGTNHPKSVWFYMAAIRRDPLKHGWAWERIYSDALHPCLCQGVPAPDLSFLKSVEEFNGAREWGRWEDAIANAKVATHLPRITVSDPFDSSRH